MPGNNLPVLTMKSGIGAVSSPLIPGWVSGDIASLAALGSVNVIFNLGSNWDQYNYLQVAVAVIGPSTGLSAVQVFGSTTPGIDATSPRLGPIYSVAYTPLSAAITVAGGVASAIFRPMGQYVAVSATNADGVSATGAASKITLGAYPV